MEKHHIGSDMDLHVLAEFLRECFKEYASMENPTYEDYIRMAKLKKTFDLYDELKQAKSRQEKDEILKKIEDFVKNNRP